MSEMDLARKEINRIDAEMAALFEQRMHEVERIARYKKENGLPVRDPRREAALIDGAGEFRILVSIILPLSKALIASFSLFAIVGMWNSYFSALLYIKDASRQPIQMILRSIVFTTNAMGSTFGSDANVMLTNGSVNPLNVQYACLVATIAPLLLIYPFIQKYFEQGMQVGAVKG